MRFQSPLKHLIFSMGIGACLFSGLSGSTAFAGDVPRYISVEMNPLAPLAASRETAKGNTTSMWDFGVDFNVASKFSTGPEIWLGTFAVRSEADDQAERVRREEFQYAERHHIDATKINWNVSLFESNYSMRGWFVRGGYSYTKINSKAKRYAETDFSLEDAEISQSLITEYRHGVYGSFGQRWHFWEHNATVSISLSYTHNFKHNLSTDGQDPDAEADYLTLIEQIPDTRLSAKPMPSADFRLGFLF